jgi:hypothetical protein
MTNEERFLDKFKMTTRWASCESLGVRVERIDAGKGFIPIDRAVLIDAEQYRVGALERRRVAIGQSVAV